MATTDVSAEARRISDLFEVPCPDAVVGKYRLDRRLGEGGSGVVWRAWDSQLARWVALKFMKSPRVEERTRFAREAQLAARLTHPHIAAVYEAAPDYIAMQLVEGRSLDQAARRADLRTRVELVRQAALAVHYAHEQGVVHRDLKPGNILVDDAMRHAVVLDFGLARPNAVGASITASGVVMGTPAYMSPEQARGRTVGPRGDVYALGATLYEVIEGRPPFRAADTYELLRQVVEDEPAPPAVDAALQSIVMKSMRKDSLGRYATAGALAEDLRRWLEGEPVSARPLSTVVRLRRWIGRRKAAVALACAVALCVLLVVGQTVRLRRRAAVERERAAARIASLVTLRSVVTERRRDLRAGRVSPEAARGALVDAVRAIDRHLAEWPDDAAAFFMRGRGRLELGDAAGAESDARASLEKFRPGWTLLGLVLMHRCQQRLIGPGWNRDERFSVAAGLLEEARRAFERGVGGAADAARHGLGWTREDDVAEQLAAALPQAMRFDDRAAARRILEAHYAEYRDEELARWIGLLSPDADAYVRWQSEAIALAPGWELPYYDRAFGRFVLGDLAGAEADLSEALRLRPDWVEALVSRGAYRSRLDRLAHARADLDRVLELRPDCADARHNLGIVAERAGDAALAVAEYDRAVELQETHAESRFNRAALRWRAGDRVGAVSDYDCVIELRPDWCDPVYNRGLCFAHLGRLAEAIADFDSAIALRPDYAEALTNRAVAKDALNDAAGAREDRATAARLKAARGR